MYLQNISKGNKMLEPGNHNNLNDSFRQIIAEDSDGIFLARYLDRENYPDVTFQALAIRWLDGKSWEQMAAEFEISSVRLRRFYHQSLSEFRPYLRERLEE